MTEKAILTTICFCAALALGGCDSDPTEAVVVNEFPAEGPEAYTIEKLWFRSTLFFRPVAPGETSESLRVGTGAEPAYAIVAIGDPPRRFVTRTHARALAYTGESFRIVVSPATTRSACFGVPRLTRDEHDFITSRIFPGDAVEPFEAGCSAP